MQNQLIHIVFVLSLQKKVSNIPLKKTIKIKKYIYFFLQISNSRDDQNI